MLFTLKKVIGNMLLPLPLILLIIGAGLALLWFSRFQKLLALGGWRSCY